MSALSLQLPDDIAKRLKHLTERTGHSNTFYILEALTEHLDDLEDLYLAEQRLIALREGGSNTVPLEAVMKRYKMEN